MIQKFTQNGFDLVAFKELLVQMFGSKISFIKPTTQRYKEHTHILEKIQICENIALADSNELEILIFKVSSINAKIALHSELKRILRNSYSDAILAVFCQDTQNQKPFANETNQKSLASENFNQKSPSLAEGDLGGGSSKDNTNSHLNSQNSTTTRHSEPATVGEESTAKSVNLKMDENSQNSVNFSPNSQENSQNQAFKEFRLSLITSKLDKNNIKYSNLKRQSFILGHSKTHTAQKALATLISKANITLQDLENAFSQEPVSKEFYKEIIEQYLEILECATFPAHATQYDKKSFCLRLLCRILFCKFLEKKALLSAEIWDTNLSKDYYHEALEPLFFATLNTPASLRDYGLLPTQITNLLSKIPYLNGGLFSPQDKDFYNLIYISTLHIPNAAFDNLFALLDRYNFTLDENSYNDYEISLNPELLGTVFESLLSQLFTDNAAENLQSLRKATGSYYTPREIVSYMVRQSLFAYLKNSTKINENKLHALVFDENFAENSNQKSLASENFNQKSPSPAEGDLGGGYENAKTPKNSQNSTITRHSEPATAGEESTAKSVNLNTNPQENPQNPLTQAQKTELLSSLKNLKILDPACGSGAFPMGILNEILLLQEKCGDERDIYERKLELLQGCIYGIDIQPMATEIARLRCFLSLIIDENPSDIKPLPNLEFKFMQGNSLLETLSVGRNQVEIIPQEFLSSKADSLFDDNELKKDTEKTLFKEENYKNLQSLFKRYFSVNQSQDKQNLKAEILGIIQSVFYDRQQEINEKIEELNEKLRRPSLNSKDAQKIADTISDLMHFGAALQSLLDDYATHDFSSDKLFLYRFFFAEVMQNGGFDIIIGNPPYGAKISESDKKAYKMHYKHAILGSIDTYKLFIEKGFNLLKNNGYLSFIVPITITSSKSNTNLHKMLLANCEQIEVSSYGERPAKVFENAEQKVSIISFTKTLMPCKTLLTTGVNKRYSTQSVANVIENMSFINSLEFVRDGAFCKIAHPIEKAIMQKLYAQKFTLKDFMQGAERVYYRDTGNRYYNLFTNYSTTKSTTEKCFAVSNSNAIVALMTSNLFWWFKNAYAEGRHSYIYEFEPFPVPKFSDEIWQKLDTLGKELQADIEKKANFTSTGTKEYRLRKSKHLIDQIDRLICPLYNLTPAETEFIINYELEFRTDG